MSRRRKHVLQDLAMDVLIGGVGGFEVCQLCGLLRVPQTLAAHLVEGFALFQSAVIQVTAATQHKEQGVLLRAGRVQAIVKRFPGQHPVSFSAARAWTDGSSAQTSALLLDRRGTAARGRNSSILAGETVIVQRDQLGSGGMSMYGV